MNKSNDTKEDNTVHSVKGNEERKSNESHDTIAQCGTNTHTNKGRST